MSMWQAIGDDADSHPDGKKNFRSKPQPIVFLAGLDFSHTRWSYPLIGPHHRPHHYRCPHHQHHRHQRQVGRHLRGTDRSRKSRSVCRTPTRLHRWRPRPSHQGGGEKGRLEICCIFNHVKVPQIQYSVLDVSGIIAIIIGFTKIYGLPEKTEKQNHTLDVCLLRFGLFFNFLFFLFTSALTVAPNLRCTGDNGQEETLAANSLHLLNGIVSIVYCVLNVLFIELLLHKTIEEGDTQKPGRQVG